MRLTEEKMKELLFQKLNDDFDSFIDELIKGGRQSLKNAIPELTTKYEIMLEFEYFFPLEGKSLRSVCNKKNPLDFLYKEWQKDVDLRTEDFHFAINEIAKREANRIAKHNSEPER